MFKPFPPKGKKQSEPKYEESVPEPKKKAPVAPKKEKEPVNPFEDEVPEEKPADGSVTISGDAAAVSKLKELAAMLGLSCEGGEAGEPDGDEGMGSY
jgi:hypothetical protein